MIDPELEAAIRRWMANGPTAAPRAVVDDALLTARSVGQGRSFLSLPSLPALARPSIATNRMAASAVAVAVVIMAVVAGINVLPNRTSAPGGPSADATGSGSIESPSPPTAVPSAASPLPGALSEPFVALTGRRSIDTDGPATRFDLSITNWEDYPRALFARTRDLPPCGNTANSSRSWVAIRDATSNEYLSRFCVIRDRARLSQLWFAIPGDSPIPAAIYVEIQDRLTQQTVRSVNVPTGDVPGNPDPSAPPDSPPPAGTTDPPASAVPTPPATPGPAGWNGPTFISERGYWEPSLAIDGDGDAHAAALLGDGIWYVTNRRGRWTRERLSTAAPGGQDRAPSLAIDSDGSLWVAFARFTTTVCQVTCEPAGSDGIYVVNNSSGSWSDPVRVGSPGNEGPSLDVRDGRVHIAATRWVEPLGYAVFYITDGSGSVTEQQLSASGQEPGLRLGADGLARIAFVDSAGSELAYATAQSAVGDFVVVAAGPSATGSLFALDAGDRPHIALSQSETDSAYVTLTDAGWTTPQHINMHGRASDFDVSASGMIHAISNYYPGGSGVWHVAGDAASLTETQLFVPGPGGLAGPNGPSALALDGSGRPHVLVTIFNEVQGNGLWYAIGPAI